MLNVNYWKARVLRLCSKCELCVMLRRKLLPTFSSWEDVVEKEFWGLTFEDPKTYGMDILGRLQVKRDMKQQKFIMIHEIEICETTW
jgi:hypothetical protein